MFNISYTDEESKKYPTCKKHGYCSEDSLIKKLQEVTLYGLAIFSKHSGDLQK